MRVTDIFLSGDETGDLAWPMPLHKPYGKGLKSKLADTANLTRGPPGSITAALFLKQFVNSKNRWAHLDVAGLPLDSDRVATPYGVSLLTSILESIAEF